MRFKGSKTRKEICISKIPYGNRIEANEALQKFQQEFPNCRSKRIYLCNICGKFHLSKIDETTRRREKIDRVVEMIKGRKENANLS